MREVAVISKNKELVKLIELEAELYGIKTRHFDAFAGDVSRFSAVYVDLDLSKDTELYGQTLAVGISSEDIDRNVYGMDVMLGYPPRLCDIRDTLLEGNMPQAEKEGNVKVLFADDNKSSVGIDGEEIALSKYEYKLLERLCLDTGACVGRDELSELLRADSGNIVDVYVCHLRKKLERGGERKIIYTVRNQGYKTDYRILKKR